HRDLHSFPTRRSSDLQGSIWCEIKFLSRPVKSCRTGRMRFISVGTHSNAASTPKILSRTSLRRVRSQAGTRLVDQESASTRLPRSEEHTSELQSRGHL